MFHVIQAKILLRVSIRLQKFTVSILNSVIYLHLLGNKVIRITNLIRNKVGLCETPPVFIVQEKEKDAEMKLRLVYWLCRYETS
jgi:hypothetical protein